MLVEFMYGFFLLDFVPL